MQQFNQNNLDLQNSGEQIVWKGSSSQLLNFKHFTIAIIIIIAAIWASLQFKITAILLVGVIALVYALYHYLIVNAATYTITNQRLISKVGLFNRATSEIELYRVKDVHLFEPLQLRMFGLGTIHLISSQRSSPLFELKAIKGAVELREQLRHLVENRRNEKGVGEYDTN
ncbi:PH domain-containing protein [Taibaiella lutea]|uniref:PH domain-containing protein n=1 Tax=Taibaiella lutea TaxID=2608001 RepID=A0A5M6CJC1_9BACT|nr:PH domain-containing protein [Taibaiella lutea]KAA5533199.1 PH domain-containing protein [Taibaiella lutea]